MTLFEPIKVGTCQLQHRVVHAPLTRLRNTEDNIPTDLVAEYYSQRATEGGLLIAEATAVSSKTGGYPRIPGVFTKEQQEGWSKVIQGVHGKGGYIFSQLWHGGRAGSSLFLENNLAPFAPSPIAIRGDNQFTNTRYEVPREATQDDIKDFIQQYITAAKNAIDAGFDGVEIHAANGYLIHQFISSSSNKRTDIYGGSIKNRARFVLELTEAVVNAIGAERTAIRFSPWGGSHLDVDDDTPYETYSHILKKLDPKLAYVHFVEPRDDFLRIPDLENSLDPFRKVWKDNPFITAGGYTTRPETISAVSQETGNLVAIGRAFTSNPDLVYRLKNDLPLSKHQRDYFYTTDAIGYTDYQPYDKNANP
ncbi:hypothetical protein BDA99DRAFT_562345 [Phascolomyces articulosus]|uniref:NADH:flavin oxidoreductase/NADH oxidase N-terminal domain-containing protein n=1 Tax=Phascolomyces articulosus TaxID=60185 RepID=A0AAD5PCY1_9FUNG|nr:hypothetical protein BDA99DRAFT_562345 [Phascolomyces articulosus]